MRIDSTAEKNYQTALSAIKKTLEVEVKKFPLFVVEKSELPELKPELKGKPYILNYVRGFYNHKEDSIFVVSGYEEDLQTILHETLHSNSCLHSNNSPYWIHEGLTEALTEYILKKENLSYDVNLPISEEVKFWRKMLQSRKIEIVRAYFNPNPEKCYSTLEKATGISGLKNKDFRKI